MIEIKQTYQLARYPITYAQFQCFINAPDVADSNWWEDIPKKLYKWHEQRSPFNNHPSVRVSWYQSVAFCRWLSDKLGLEIRLPYEEEWEVAARYPDGRTYPWGNEWDSNKANTEESGIGQTTAVGLYPNGQNLNLGLYDLSGNVWEWCQNKYKNSKSAKIDASGNWRALRGGSWMDGKLDARTASQYSYTPANRNDDRGFRVMVVRHSPSHQ